MQHYPSQIISGWDRFFRANFVNCLSGTKPACLIGTVGEDGTHNLALFSNIVHLGADPALIGIVNRPRAATPHTLSNIEATGVFTINHVTGAFLAKAHQTSAKYPSGTDEFWEVGLEKQFLAGIVAPFVLESPVKYGLKLEEIMPIRTNGTFLVIGKLMDVFLDGVIVGSDGNIDLAASGVLASVGLETYLSVTLPVKLPYARP